MDTPNIRRQLRRFINLMLITFWLVGLGLTLTVGLAIPVIDWRLYVLGAAGGFSSAAFVGHYLFKGYLKG